MVQANNIKVIAGVVWRFSCRTVLGAFSGYTAYIPVIYAVEYALYGRADSEKVFYALFCPIWLISLLLDQDNTYLPKDELILTISGSFFVISGIIVANRKQIRKLMVLDEKL